MLALRRRPIAVLRALGASAGYVFATVWMRVVLLSSAGGLVGLGLGWVGVGVLSQLLEAHTGMALPVAIAAPELLLVLGVVAAAAALAIIPAFASSRMPVADGLRQPGWRGAIGHEPATRRR